MNIRTARTGPVTETLSRTDDVRSKSTNFMHLKAQKELFYLN